MSVGVHRGSDRDEMTFPEQILAHRLTRDCQTERGEIPADFLDKGGEIVIFVPVHCIAELILEEDGIEGLFLDILP